jgi:hypothetical protein
MPPRSGRATLFLLAGAGLVILLASLVRTDGRADAPAAADPFPDKVVPFLKTWCFRCHNARTKNGELDLTRFDTSAKILEDFRQWETVVAFLKKGEMPPAKAKQPPAELRKEVVKALEKVLLAEARKLSGDPGVVPPRRLSNAEYDCTIHDLTGVDIQPAKSFPVDPASGEGFNNTGEALTMTPNLFKKYYAAAEHVANHALLTTEGLRFAPHPVVTFADRQKFCEQAILHFYEAHAVDHAKYFTALWLYKHRPASHTTATLEGWAKEAGLSAKYSRLLWETVEGKSEDRFLIRWLRSRWLALPVPKDRAAPTAAEVQAAVRALAADIQRATRELCPKETPAIVANAGNGPIEHLARRRQTAAHRDTFDMTTLQRHKATVEYRNATELSSLEVVIQLEDAGTVKAEGLVILDVSFTTTAPTTDKTRKWSLRDLLGKHAPEQFEKLKFGMNARGERIGPNAFVLKAPATLRIELPAKAFPLRGKGNITLASECKLDRTVPGAVRVHVSDRKMVDRFAQPSRLLISPKHPLATAYETSAAAFGRLFPNRFFHVDATRGLSAGFHLIEGFFRDDQPLCRSVLSDAQKRELNRLWTELYFVTGIWEKMLRGFVFFERSERNFLKHTDFDSFKEEDPELVKDETLARFQDVYLRRSNVKLTGDALANHPISIFFRDVRNGLKWQTRTLKQAEPIYLQDLLAFAERACRRPLSVAERKKLEKFYTDACRDKDHGTDAAVRASIVRLLVSPHFCMRFTAVPPGDSVAALSDLELASRLSYFLWSGPPDDELLALARAGRLHHDKVLGEQVRRMVRDPRMSRFAREFFGQWLGYRDFLTRESVDRKAFPAFDDALKQAMFEEPTRLLTHLIRTDGPITDLLNGDLTFVNRRLAQHYGLPWAGSGEWESVTGLRQRGRGGLLGMAVFQTRNSQPQRTSPVKRGFWVVHKVLGEHIPPPPPDVAVLPARETETKGKTIRELMKLHVEDVKCARCHQRFDPVGLAMEGFDPIGRARTRDLAGRAIDDVVSLPDGKMARGVPAFADHLVKHRKQEFIRTLVTRFLGYALGRSLQLSDQPLLEQMQVRLEKNDYKLSVLFDVVATSPQFRTKRCRDFSPAKFKANSSPGEKK